MDQRIISYFIAFIFFILGLFFAIRGHSSEYNRYVTLTYSQGKYYREKKNWHQDQAILAFERAHEKFWFLPRISDRSMARSCFTTAIATATASTPQSKVMAAIVNIMITYGLAALDEWDYINYNLAEAQHHFELMEFYNDILNKG
jgi:hypothetical protein